MNYTYRTSKLQFEQDMKMFKETDILKEEEQIYEENQEPMEAADILKTKKENSSFIPSCFN